MLPRYPQGRFLAYSSPVMLISRKMMQDKRVMTDLRHLNMKIAKNNPGISFIERYLHNARKLKM